MLLGLDSAAPIDQSLLNPPTAHSLGPIRAPRHRGQLQPSALCVFHPVSPTDHTWPTIFVVVTCHNQGWLTRSNASVSPPGPLMGPPPGCLVTVGDGVSLWPTILIVGAVKSQHIIVSEGGQLASRRQIQRPRGARPLRVYKPHARYCKSCRSQLLQLWSGRRGALHARVVSRGSGSNVAR